MGRYEDLLAQAREGDESAFEALESEFNVSTLREKAEQADTYRKNYEKALPMLRQSRLAELTAKLPDDLKEAGLDIGDFGDFDPNDLTLETVQEKAQAKSETTQAARLAVAQEAGFDSVEEYQEALEVVKQQKEQRKTGMEGVASGITSSGGEPPGASEPTSKEVVKENFEAAKQEGFSDDVAMARGVDALLQHQVTVLGAGEE